MSDSLFNPYAPALAANDQQAQRRALMAQRLMGQPAPQSPGGYGAPTVSGGGDAGMGGAPVQGLGLRDISSAFSADQAKREAAAKATGQPVEPGFFDKIGNTVGGWFSGPSGTGSGPG